MLITYQATLLEKKQLAPEITLFKFSYPDMADWNFKAGQYMIFHIPQDTEHTARRLYSIASPPAHTDSLDFVIEHVPNGIGSTFLLNMALGQTLNLQGPAGVFTFKENARNKIFLATGTGIAPMRSMIHTILDPGHPDSIMSTAQLYLFWGMKNCSDMYYLDEFKLLAERNLNFSPQLCFSRETTIESVLEEARKYASLGRVTNGFEALITKLNAGKQEPLPDLLNSFDYYICGSNPVVETLKTYLAEKGILKENIVFEKFTN